MKKIFIFSIIICFILLNLSGASLVLVQSSAGGWQLLLDSYDLSCGPGSDFNPTAISVPACDRLSIETDAPDSPWSLQASIYNSQFPLTVELQITDMGDGAGTCSVLSDFVDLSAEYITIASGTGSRSDIRIQYRVSDLSVNTLQYTRQHIEIVYTLVQ